MCLLGGKILTLMFIEILKIDTQKSTQSTAYTERGHWVQDAIPSHLRPFPHLLHLPHQHVCHQQNLELITARRSVTYAQVTAPSTPYVRYRSLYTIRADDTLLSSEGYLTKFSALQTSS